MHNEQVQEQRQTPLFTILSAVFVVISLASPIILLTLPLMATCAMAIVALFRKERPRWIAPVVLVIAFVLFVAAGSHVNSVSGTGASDLSSVKLVDSSWEPDPSFGTDGTVKWRGLVKNLSDKSIRNVRLNFTSFDKSGKLLASTFAYVDAIPAGETRATESFADLYGNEDKASIDVAEVHFSGE